jgi:uncharacterized protein YndB with AHSA1/START domain
MKAIHGNDETVVQAKAERIWEILENSTLLPQWAPMVKSTTGKTERVGSVRTCQVEWEGRKDEVAERCIEAIPDRKITWIMEQGMMTKMFSRIQFGFILEPKNGGATLLHLGFLYAPTNLFARFMYSLVMRRKLDSLRKTLLANIKNLAVRS